MELDKKELPEQTQSGQQSAVRKDETPLRDIFNRFLEEDLFSDPFDFSGHPRLASLFNKQFIPRVDISETNTHVRVVADVPGVAPEHIDLEVEGDRMKISGTTVRESEPNERPYRYERTYGEFRREFILPSHVRKEEIKAVYKDGVLSITIPKEAEGQKKSKIQIQRQ